MNAPARSRLVTVLAWLLMAASVLLLPISFISALMFLAGSYGTANASLGGALLVLFGPAATLLAGFGLWRRWRWAWAYVLLLMLAILAVQVAGWWRGPTPRHSYVSDSGVPTTVLASEAQYSTPLVLACAMVLVLLALPSVRAEFFPARTAAVPRGWRLGHLGRDRMYYEEWRDGAWQRLDIEGEMLVGEAHHAVYLAAPDRWQHYPAWARERREEIVSRIRSEFREPGYVYGGELSGIPPSAPAARAAAAHLDGSSRVVAWGVAIGLLLLAAFMGWLVWHGLESGETWWPAKYTAARRIVDRVADPAMYWTALALYSVVGLGSLGLLGWSVRASRAGRVN